MAQPCADPRAIALAPRSAAISEGTLVDVPTAAGPACPLSFAPQQYTALAPPCPTMVQLVFPPAATWLAVQHPLAHTTNPGAQVVGGTHAPAEHE